MIGAPSMKKTDIAKESFNLQGLFPKNEWWPLIKQELGGQAFKRLEDQIYVDYHQLSPSPSNIFRAFELIQPKEVRVVIIGQDPYQTPQKANGLAFSVCNGVKIPPSLRNILKEAGVANPIHGDLISWVQQGVLLINSALTTRIGEAGAHLEYWQPFTDSIISAIIKEVDPIFLLWGKHAQSKEALTQHCWALKAAHPSRYSAHRGFFGCEHFRTVNALLKARGQEPIDWGRGIGLPESASFHNYSAITE